MNKDSNSLPKSQQRSLEVTDEQRRAFAILDNLLTPSQIAALTAQGNRKNWIEIDNCIEFLREIFK
jgi:hypothetical protein